MPQKSVESLAVLTDVWRDLSSRLTLHTASQAADIPEAPGVYAWFFPLDIEASSLDEVSRAISENLRATCYYSAKSKAEGRLHLGWESLSLEAKREARVDFGKKQAAWKSIVSNEKAFQRLREALYVATLFCRPLYVGLTNRTLRGRYEEHVTGRKRDFNTRFTAHMDELKLSYRVEDLLFACVPLQTSRYSERQVKLLEEVLKHLCQPPFGVR